MNVQGVQKELPDSRVKKKISELLKITANYDKRTTGIYSFSHLY